LADGVELAGALHDTALATRTSNDAAKLEAGVATLWDPSTKAYDWAEGNGGARQATVWSNIYPDALEQLWAVTYGLVPAARATELLTEFQAAQPNWAQPTDQAMERGTSAGVFLSTISYWPIGVWAYAAAGQTALATADEASIRSAAAAANYAWPYTPAIAAELIVGQGALAPTP